MDGALKQPEPISLEDVPGAPSPGTVLCSLEELGPREGKGFVFKDGSLRFEMFLQRWDDAVYAYQNQCPHMLLPLDIRPGRFLDFEKQHLHCANHGALFRVQDGHCIKGPCKGDYLTPVLISRKGDEILVG